ncbi:MAG: NERD domain-containing protein [Flavobacteriales bacterium]|nr:MAG: NERD domain-containing protein [Flavobacteriales bacterium]
MDINLIILVSIFFIILLWGFYKARIKGVIGEKTTAALLYFLDKSKYKVVHDVVLASEGRTTQIDHVIIADFGIFVIETKNYKGWIFGNENSEYWTQVIFKRKEKLYNPIRQNLAHIKALRKCLVEFPKIEYKSIIVFPSKASLKINTITDVVYSYNLLATIKEHSEINLCEADKQKIYQKICAFNLADTFNKREHVKSIKQSIQKSEVAINKNKCPQCNGDLILRKGKFGEFLGCRSYPACKFTSQLR